MLRILALAIVGRLVLVSSTGAMICSIVPTTIRGGQQYEEENSEIITGVAEDVEYQSPDSSDNIHEEPSNSPSLGPQHVEAKEIVSEKTSEHLYDLYMPSNSSTEETKDIRRKKFLDHVARVSSYLLRREEDAKLVEIEEELFEDADKTTHQSDLTRPGRYVHIVTTAALPWFTGTAVNPLLRAAYLHERLLHINSNTASSNLTAEETTSSWVTLVIPWLELEEDQQKVYNGQVFDSPEKQEEFVRDWLRNQAHMPGAAEHLNIVFYNARYHAGLGSVFAMGDIIQDLPQDQLDVCILEEPEVSDRCRCWKGSLECLCRIVLTQPHYVQHINWFRAPGQGWTKRYNYVVGIIHTNYNQYATQHYTGLWSAPAIRVMSAAMIRAYCHKVIKLSDILQPFAPEKEVTVNVHGVRQEFIQNSSEVIESENLVNGGNQTYFIGKILWTKGLDVLLELQDYYKEVFGEYFDIDIYGSGPEQDEIQRAYLGRRPQEEKQSVPSNPKRRFAKLFARVKQRRLKRKRKVTIDDLHRDLMEIIDAWPVKAKESVEALPSKVRDKMEKLSDDLAKAKDSMESLPLKAREALGQLSKDFSRFKSKLPKSRYELRRKPIPATFPGRVDHASLKLSYNIFVNPSVSEVLCTTTAEALAMGKFAIIPVHPSNTFFLKFPNCLAYRSPDEFVANLQWALTHDPAPLTEELAREFTWEAATDRLLEACAITHREARERELLGKSKVDERIAWFHNQLGKGVKGDVIRKVFGGGPVSHQVKYSKRKRGKLQEEEDYDDEEEGLSRKFRESVLVRAIQQATANSMYKYEYV